MSSRTTAAYITPTSNDSSVADKVACPAIHWLFSKAAFEFPFVVTRWQNWTHTERACVYNALWRKVVMTAARIYTGFKRLNQRKRKFYSTLRTTALKTLLYFIHPRAYISTITGVYWPSNAHFWSLILHLFCHQHNIFRLLLAIRCNLYKEVKNWATYKDHLCKLKLIT
jgi:hypothetical protein